jgi:hypothetical protein
MAQLSNIEPILRTMREYGWKHYRIQDLEGKNLFFQDFEDITLDEAVGRFERDISCVSGPVRVAISDKSQAGKGRGGNVRNQVEYTIHVTPTYTQPNIGSIASPVTAGIDPMDIEKRISAAVEDVKKDFKIQQLQEQIKELRQGDPMENQLIGMLTNLFAPKAGAPLTMAVSGYTPEVATAEPSEQEVMARIGAAVQKIADNDPNYLENLEALANLAENNKPVYNMAVQQLKSLS